LISWDERYAGDGFFYGTEPNDFLKEQARRIAPAGQVLCLAEGEGRNATHLAELGHVVTAVDQSAVGLEKASRLAASRGVALRTEQADLADWHLQPGAWDAVVSIWCHLPGVLRARVHREVVAGLRPGGVFILEAYTPDQMRHGTGGPKDPDLMPTLAQLQAELAGLVFEIGIERERDVREGGGHTGHSSVVQVVARRVAPGGGPA